MCNYDHYKLKIFHSFNAIYSKFASAKSELVCVQLMKSYCLPVLMYAIEATWPSKSITKMLDNIVTLAVKKIFKLKQYDLIDNTRQNIGLYHITDLGNIQKLKFMNRFLASSTLQAKTILNICSRNDYHCLV